MDYESLVKFINESCLVGDGCEIILNELFDQYLASLDKTPENLTVIGFGQNLYHYFIMNKLKGGPLPRKNRETVWIGITLKDTRYSLRPSRGFDGVLQKWYKKYLKEKHTFVVKDFNAFKSYPDPSFLERVDRRIDKLNGFLEKKGKFSPYNFRERSKFVNEELEEFLKIKKEVKSILKKKKLFDKENATYVDELD